jgi:hypothetical protein
MPSIFVFKWYSDSETHSKKFDSFAQCKEFESTFFAEHFSIKEFDSDLLADQWSTEPLVIRTSPKAGDKEEVKVAVKNGISSTKSSPKAGDKEEVKVAVKKNVSSSKNGSGKSSPGSDVARRTSPKSGKSSPKRGSTTESIGSSGGSSSTGSGSPKFMSRNRSSGSIPSSSRNNSPRGATKTFDGSSSRGYRGRNSPGYESRSQSGASSPSMRSSGTFSSSYSRRGVVEVKIKIPGVRPEEVYKTNSNVAQRVRSIRYYAVVFGHTHGVFNLEEYKLAVDGCEFARFRDYETRSDAVAWYESERKSHLTILKENFQFEKLEEESENAWLDRAVAHFSKTSTPLAEKNKNRKHHGHGSANEPQVIATDEDLLSSFKSKYPNAVVEDGLKRAAYVVFNSDNENEITHICSPIKYTSNNFRGGKKFSSLREALCAYA